MIYVMTDPCTPTTNGGVQKWKPSRNMYIHVACMFLHVPAPICTLSRCLLTKISASELRRKIVKSALLVGHRPCFATVGDS